MTRATVEHPDSTLDALLPSVVDAFVRLGVRPIVDWNLTPRRPRILGRILRHPAVRVVVMIALFALVSATAPRWAVAAGAVAVVPLLVAQRDLLLGWRLAVLASVAAWLWFEHGVGVRELAAMLLAVFTFYVSLRFGREIALWAWAVTIPVVAALLQWELSAAIPLGALLALLTDTLRGRRLTALALADQQEMTDVERARRIGVEERTRVARELHDVVAHHMSMVAVRAETAPFRLPDLSEEVRAEFAEISQAARESLNEIRSLLSVLRSDEAPRMPQPGLAQIEDLIASTRDAGVELSLTVQGDPRPLREALEGERLPDPSGGAVECHPPRTRTAGRGVDRLRRCQPGDDGGESLPGGPRTSRPRAHRHERASERRRGHRERSTPSRRPLRGGGEPAHRAMIRVLVVDDQAMVREGFTALLDADPEIQVVGDAADGAAAVAAARRLKPDVILMDVRMPEMDGLEATRRILADGSDETKVVMLTTFDIDEYVYEAIQAGASGFLLKDAPAATLVEAVKVVAAGDALLAPSVTRRLISDLARRPRVTSSQGLDELTDREKEVLIEVARGLSNREIAEALFIFEQTVKTHVSRILTKLDLRDRAQMVIAAYEAGLV